MKAKIQLNIALCLLAMFYYMAHIGLPIGAENPRGFDDLESK